MDVRHTYSTISWFVARLMLLMMMMKTAHSPCTTVHLVKTSGGSVEQISLPDEQALQLLFWMEETGEKESEGSSERDLGNESFPLGRGHDEEEEEETEDGNVGGGEFEEDEGPLVPFEEPDEEENGRLIHEEEEVEEGKETTQLKTERQGDKTIPSDGKRTAEKQVQGGIERGKREEGELKEEDNIVTLSYFVSSAQYPTLTFSLPQRNVWYAAYFDYFRVSIPVANVSKDPQPNSWWGRTVNVSSVSTVYWHLCTSQHCVPGNPTNLLQVANIKPTAYIEDTTEATNPGDAWSVDRKLVVALSVVCGSLLPVCLGLLVMVITLMRRRRSSQATTGHHSHSCRCRCSQQRRNSTEA